MQVARSVRKRWAAAAAQYAQAVALASDWGFLSNLAALLLGADDEAGYRAACHELLEKHGSTDNAIQSFSMATVCLLGENSVDDAEKVLILAKKRAAESDSRNPVFAAAWGVAQYRAGKREAAIATLKKSLPADTPALMVAPEQAARIQLSRLFGETILAQAYKGEGDATAVEQQLTTVRKLIEQLEKAPPKPSPGLAAWGVPLAVELVKRELSEADATSAEPSK